jgi:hypothetical protein
MRQLQLDATSYQQYFKSSGSSSGDTEGMPQDGILDATIAAAAVAAAASASAVDGQVSSPAVAGFDLEGESYKAHRWGQINQSIRPKLLTCLF